MANPALDIAYPIDAPSGPLRVHRPSPPRRRSRSRARDPRVHVAQALDPSRVLIAEDDPEMRSLLVEAFTEAGYQVIEVADGRQLLDCIANPRNRGRCPEPDLVVSDIRMPGHTGLDVLGALRQRDWAMPVMIITAFGSPQTHAEARRLGAAAVFDKPLDVDALVEAATRIAPP